MTIWVNYAERITDTFAYNKCALLVVDVQTSFCSPNGRTAKKHANQKMQAVPERINSFVEIFKKQGGLPIYLKSTPDIESSNPIDKWINTLKGYNRPLTSMDPELDLYGLSLPDDALIIEKTGDGFSGSKLGSILKENNIENVLVCGVRTEICVRRVAERSSTEGYRVFVLRDLCATRDDNDEHANQALMFINAYTGIVLESKKMLNLLGDVDKSPS